MTQAEVVRLVGEPLFGYECLGDRTLGRSTAIYRQRHLRAVEYQWGG